MIATPARLISCLLVTATAALDVRADDYSFAEKFDRSQAFKPDGEITLENTNGAVVIRTWDRPEIRIEGEKRAKTEEELKLIAVGIDLTQARLAFKTNFPKRGGLFSGNHVRGSVTVTLTVPATARLQNIETTNGPIAIEGVRGPVRAHSVNGRITATGLVGDTSLETVNGSVNAEFAAVSREQKIAARTVNGSTTISFPKDASLTLRAQSVNGAITCDFPLQLEGKSRRNRISGKVGEGAALLEIETVNGSIHVKQR